jgi:hypothetical protein
MVSVRFEIAGEPAWPHAARDPVRKAVLEHIHNDLVRKLTGIRCREHGGTVQVLVKGPNINQLSYDVQGCCESLGNEVLAKIK